MKRIVIVAGVIACLGITLGISLHTKSPAGDTSAPSPVLPLAIQKTSSAPSAAPASQDAVSSKPSGGTTLSSQHGALRPVVKPTEVVGDDGTRYPLRHYKTLALPNDPGADQWWVTATNLPAAWPRGYGDYQTTVAVIDTGFALAHDELAGRWAINTGEQGATSAQAASVKNCTDRGLAVTASCNLIDDDYNTIVDDEVGSVGVQNPSQLNCTDRGLALNKKCNLVDDDANSYVDDVRGWDFANYDSSVQAGQTNPYGEATTHGTMTSGTLGASGNNGKGIAGVNWNTRILPLQAIDDDGYGDTLTLARAVQYAAARHVDIISLSLGSEFEDPYLRKVIDDAILQGVMVVAATGNDGCDCISFPARYPEVLGVGASNQSGEPADFSNYGSSLDILAPGEDMILPAWSPTYQTNGYISGAAGTSFATPYVAGLLAQLKSLQPTATYTELVAALNESSDQTSLTADPPWSATHGYGIAHAGRSTLRVSIPSTPAIRYGLGPMSSGTILDSVHVYDCQTATRPSLLLYELSKGAQKTYTTSELTRYQHTLAGWSSRSLGYQCAGLPIDQPVSVRNINLRTEIGNSFDKY